MIAMNNRRNHNFQIEHFIAGSCHTPDAAYSILCDLREDRRDALAQVEASKLRTKAKILRAEKLIREGDEIDKLEAEAELAEIRGFEETVEKNIAAAKAELAYIDECIAKVQPFRKYAHLTDPEAHEAIQREEWALEFEHRAVNFLLTAGTIPHDHFSSMRQHPDFHTHIFPSIEKAKFLMSQGKVEALLAPTQTQLALGLKDDSRRGFNHVVSHLPTNFKVQELPEPQPVDLKTAQVFSKS